MKALYRRYRPRSLSEVIGQEQITTVLEKSLKNHKVSHAYLFIGPRGTGKTSVARILAHEINGFKYELEDDYLDIIEIDAASNTGVDNIRDLREKAIIAPTKGKFKVYIIDEVHMLSKSAFNALLKTLEEPPEHVIFIMATTDAHKVPVTITSRSQVHTFKLADPSTMFEHLKDIAKKEKINIDDEALKIVVKRGGGSYRDSLSLLDQISTISDDKITAELLTKALGLPQEACIATLIDAYKAGDLTIIRNQLTDLANTGVKAQVISNELIDNIVANPEPELLPLLDKLIDVERSSNPSAKLLLALCSSRASAIIPPRQIVQPPVVQTASAPIKPKEPEKPAEPDAKPEPKPEPVASDANAEEIWKKIIEHVAEKHPFITSDVINSKYTLKDKTLTIYTGNYVKAKNIDKRRAAITEILPDDFTLVVSKEKLATDPEVANIAAIMGGGEEIEINA